MAGDPFSSFASSFGGGLGKGLGDAIGGGGGPFVGGSSGVASPGTTLDGSGWIVNVGGQQNATSTPTRTTSNSTPPLYDPAPQWVSGAGQPAQAGLGWVAGLLLVSVAAGLLLRRKG